MSPDILIEALKALLLGITEGITEWLPISSTGHMILVDEFVKLNVSDKFLELFLVVIQIGSIMAVVVTFWHKLNPVSRTKDEVERKKTWRMWGMVVIGSIPAAVLGLALDDWVHDRFYNAYCVAAMLILYGIIFIALEHFNRKRKRAVLEQGNQPMGKHARAVDIADPESVDHALFRITDPYEMDWKTALKIGFFEVLAIVPGTSRSGATIIGGMLCGCSRTAAAEFTFFLAIPVMFGWGMVKAVKFFLAGIAMTQVEIVVLVVGIVSAFAMGMIAIRFLMGYIKQNDFTVFGVYRIFVGLVVLGYFGTKAMGLI